MEKDPLVICINGFKNFHLKFCQRFGNTNEEEKVLKNVHKYTDNKIYKKWEEIDEKVIFGKKTKRRILELVLQLIKFYRKSNNSLQDSISL